MIVTIPVVCDRGTSLVEQATVVVLGDIEPGYLRASTALRACGASFGLALHLLQEPMTTGFVGVALGDAREEHSAPRA